MSPVGRCPCEPESPTVSSRSWNLPAHADVPTPPGCGSRFRVVPDALPTATQAQGETKTRRVSRPKRKRRFDERRATNSACADSRGSLGHRATSSSDGLQRGERVVRQLDLCRARFSRRWPRRRCRDEQDVGRAVEEPGERHLHRPRPQPRGDVREGRGLEGEKPPRGKNGT